MGSNVIIDHFIPNTSIEVQEICNPLFEKFDLAYFSYGKIHADGTCLALTSSPEWSGYLIENQKNVKFVSPKPKAHVQVDDIISLWEGRATPDTMKFFTGLGFYHPIMFVAMGDGYTESFSFASKHDSAQSIESYFNNLVILRKFCAYFRKVADKLVKEANKQENLLVLGEKSLAYNLDDYISQDEFAGFEIINVRIGKATIAITERQRQCLDYLSKGLTAKEIANKMGISPRTVETHLGHVKDKFNVNFKSDLLKIWEDAFYL